MWKIRNFFEQKIPWKIKEIDLELYYRKTNRQKMVLFNSVSILLNKQFKVRAQVYLNISQRVDKPSSWS